MNKIRLAGIVLLFATVAYVGALVYSAAQHTAHKIETSNTTWEQLSK